MKEDMNRKELNERVTKDLNEEQGSKEQNEGTRTGSNFIEQVTKDLN